MLAEYSPPTKDKELTIEEKSVKIPVLRDKLTELLTSYLVLVEACNAIHIRFQTAIASSLSQSYDASQEQEGTLFVRTTQQKTKALSLGCVSIDCLPERISAEMPTLSALCIEDQYDILAELVSQQEGRNAILNAFNTAYERETMIAQRNAASVSAKISQQNPAGQRGRRRSTSSALFATNAQDCLAQARSDAASIAEAARSVGWPTNLYKPRVSAVNARRRAISVPAMYIKPNPPGIPPL